MKLTSVSPARSRSLVAILFLDMFPTASRRLSAQRYAGQTNVVLRALRDRRLRRALSSLNHSCRHRPQKDSRLWWRALKERLKAVKHNPRVLDAFTEARIRVGTVLSNQDAYKLSRGRNTWSQARQPMSATQMHNRLCRAAGKSPIPIGGQAHDPSNRVSRAAPSSDTLRSSSL